MPYEHQQNTTRSFIFTTIILNAIVFALMGGYILWLSNENMLLQYQLAASFL